MGTRVSGTLGDLILQGGVTLVVASTEIGASDEHCVWSGVDVADESAILDGSCSD